MRTVTLPVSHERRSFDYYCPVCGAELAETNYETCDEQYSCPVCATHQRASRAPARRR